jgi:hypothetical protein
MRYSAILLLLLLYNCSKDQNPIQIALSSKSSAIQNVMSNLEAHEIQIKLTTISRIDDSIALTDFEFQVDDGSYFYPASTVKFPVSVLLLEKLSLDQKYTIDTQFYVEGDSTTTTYREEIRDIFAVSSNDTYNRLFEYLGKDNINKMLTSLGLPARYSHRLSTPNADELTTKPLVFIENDTTLVTTNPIINNPIESLKLNNILKGKGHFLNDELINEPMDFSKKNYLPISTLHEIMKRLMFPKQYSEEQQFQLSDSYRDFLIETMSIYPKDLGYTLPDYYDGYVKFFLFGDSKDLIPSHFKIYNKVGYAYGYLTDCAYIVDQKNDVEFILTATIHVNKDGIFNDDLYEYDEIGIPFLAQLGREIHTQLIQ